MSGAALATVLASALAATPPPPTLTLSDILGRPLIEGDRPSAATPSPDGRFVAFVWNERGDRSPRDLWLVPAAGGTPVNLTRFVDPTPALPGSLRPWKPKKGEEPRRLSIDAFDWSPRSDFLILAAGGDLYVARLDRTITRLTDTEAAEASPRVAPDATRALFVSGGILHLIGLVPGASPLLTQVHKIEEGYSISDPVFSPDGSFVAALRSAEKDRFDQVVPDYLGDKVEATKARGGFALESVRLFPVAGGDPQDPDLGVDAPGSLIGFRFSSAGRMLLIDGLSKDFKVRTLHLATRSDDGKWAARLLWREADPAWAYGGDWLFGPRMASDFSPDGSRVLFLSERSGYALPYTLAIAGGEPRVGGEAGARFETTFAAWADDQHVVVLDNRSATEERRLYLTDLPSGKSRPLVDLPGLAADPIVNRDHNILVFNHSRLAEPYDVMAAPLSGAGAVRLSDTVPARFRTSPWVVPRFFTLASGDGTPLRAMVYEPSGPAPPGGRPAVIFVHGAGYLQNVVDGWSIYSPNFKFHTRLAARGYVVLEVDYRGSAGYGRDFRTAVHMHLGGKDLADLVAGVAWLRSRGDVGKIGLYGGSYGGFLALMALFQEPERFQAGAALRFVSDWENYYRSSPGYCLQRLGTPETDAEAYRRSSPIHFAAGLRAPLLLLHGVKDSNVHFQDAAQLTARLIELGKDFELMMYPREGHGFETPESWIDEYGRIERFFDRALAAPGGAPLPAPAPAPVTGIP
jgi:dipeptidyl aminopeptidase/acylaminoacyl peptidase